MQDPSAALPGVHPHPLAAGASLSDQSLVRCAQSGNAHAFDRLVLKYRSRIVELAMRYTRNRADAEDATQETFIKAYRGLRHFRGDSAFYTWLYRIASNCARNYLKARRHDSFRNAVDFSDYRHAVRHPIRLWDLATPEELALTADIRGMANAALEGLTEEQRTAIIMREIDGLSYQQIAAAMAIPIGTVRSRVFRARDIIDHKLRRVHDGGLGRHTSQRPRHAVSGRPLAAPVSANAVRA
jgi:RNA polymerase sigma-70 factor, ECF subfamily